MTGFSPAGSYSGVTVAALRRLRVNSGRLKADLRFGHVAATLALSLLGLLLLLHVPPFMAAGADLTDPTQRDYAANLWQETQTSLALIAVVLPWMLYALLWPGASWGRRVLLVVTIPLVALTTWMMLVTASSYTALPRQVSGVVDRIQGRQIFVRGEGSYYLVLSDRELAADRSWLKPGAGVLLWVSPRGQAGAAAPVVLGD